MAIDLHAHLLPGLDDGPATLEEALAMARATLAAGVTEVAATPHVSSRYPNEPHVIRHALDGLRAALEDARLPLRVHAGAEITLDRALAMPTEALDALRIGDGPFLLLESPFEPSGSDVELVVGALDARGFRGLLAHPERSPLFQRDPGLLQRVVARGALTSVTATAFSGRFGRPAEQLARRMLHEGLVHTIASDMHDLHGRPPGLTGSLPVTGEDEALHAARLDWLTSAVPAAIVAGTTIPPGPAPPARHRSAAERIPFVRRLSRPRSA